MKKWKILLVVVSCLMITISCNNPKKQGSDGFKFAGEEERADIEITKSFFYLFPAPGEILDRFYNANLPLNLDLLHDPELADSYLTTKDKGLNLGVYITDMAYTSLFKRNSEAVEYLEVVKKLSDELNVSSAVFESLIDRAKNNLGDSDSLVVISNEVFINMVEFLEGSGMENTIAIISGGAYIESLYITLNSIDVFEEEDPLLKQIAELKYPVENLLSQAESVSDDPNVQSLLKYITELNGLFDELETSSSQAEKSNPGEITLRGGKSPVMNERNFQDMKAAIIRIREFIIGK